MGSETFENQINQHIKNSIVESIKKTDFVQTYHSMKKPLPQEFVEKVWAQVDWAEVMEKIKPQIETQVCNAIIGNISTEIKTDVKNVLSIDGVRQKIRVSVYPELMKILNNET